MMAQQNVAMGGPVGGVSVGQPGNANAVQHMTPDGVIRKLNTAIYEYMICNEKYDIARLMLKGMDIDCVDVKQSPKNQPNGVDSAMDVDSKENINMKNRPTDLPAPSQATPSSNEFPFLQDWWCQFWEVFQGQRQKGKQSMLTYVYGQRQLQKSRQMAMGMGGGAPMDGGAPMNNVIRQGYPGQPMNTLRMQAISQQQQQQQQQAMKNGQMPPGRPNNMPSHIQGNPMQANAMERQGSTMNMSDARNSGSPNTGDQGAPSPKRLRTEGSLQQLNQARPGQPGQNNQSVEAYSQAMKQQMLALQQNPHANGPMKGMPQNVAAAAAAAQQMQQGMDSPGQAEFYNNNRMVQNANGGAASQAQQNGGNHALQDYQMQLMLLEQQNKKRLLMARQEQDNMGGHPNGAPGNNGMVDPNMNQSMRAMMAPNGGPQRQPAHAMEQQMMMRAANGQMMQNGFPPGMPNGPPQGGQMMPGQQPGQPPNMIQRPGNMAPPPAPTGAAAANQPSSPAQQPAPPTPNTNKTAKNAKKDGKNAKAPAKKGANAAVNDADAPPTPTPPPPVTPNPAASFNQKNGPLANGQPNAPNQQMQNPGQVNMNGQPHNMQPTGEMMSFVDDLNPDQFGLGFSAGDSGDVLDTFDFESFLNNNDGEASFNFDANLAFGDPSTIEADGLGS